MQYKVRDWMTDLTVFIDPDSTVTDALTLMRRRNINSVIVNKTKSSPVYGIITTIDVCDHIVARDQNPSTIKVKDIMSSPLITVNQNLTIQECAAKMSEKRIHHMPVVNDKGEIVGVISATDFLWVAEMIGKGGGERVLS
jgi:CBS domain-containing protein